MKAIKVYVLEADNGCWLYKQESENERNFAKMVRAHNETDLDLWHECTNEEKEQWEAEHPQPTPEETA